MLTKGSREFVPRADGLRRMLMRECHDTLWAGHPGWHRTHTLLKEGFYWLQMCNDVMEYTKTCLTCQQDKVERQKTPGLLELLSIPTRPWESVSLDFITKLPKVGDLSGLLVVVDRFSKYATFIPTTNISQQKILPASSLNMWSSIGECPRTLLVIEMSDSLGRFGPNYSSC